MKIRIESDGKRVMLTDVTTGKTIPVVCVSYHHASPEDFPTLTLMLDEGFEVNGEMDSSIILLEDLPKVSATNG